MIRMARNLARLAAIGWTLARYDALFPDQLRARSPGLAMLARLVSRRRDDLRPGERLAQALVELGPTFIKLGQMLSTRSDLVGAEVATDLAGLQDRLPPFPGAEARAIVAHELGRPVEALFDRFDDQAVAAASIAQVHFATTTDGREVAVKVLRPQVEVAFQRDLDLLYWLADLAVRVQPKLRRLKPAAVVDIFARSTQLEMDLRMEAAAASELAGNFRGDPTFQIPPIDWERTGRRVLTLGRIRGFKVDEVDAIRASGLDPDSVLSHASAAFFNQVFRDGFFHADLHPGNLFVDAEGNVVAVDFGIVGRLDRPTRLYLADMLLGFLNGDYRRVAKVHFDAGYVPPHQSIDLFTQACRAIGEPLQNKPLNEISLGRLLAQLFAVTEQFEMETQPQLLLLQKSMLTAEGVGRILNPDVNMWELARPLIEDWMRENRGPEARLAEGLDSVLDSIRRLPQAIERVEHAAHQFAPGIRLHPDTIAGLARGQARTGRAWMAVGLIIGIVAGIIIARMVV